MHFCKRVNKNAVLYLFGSYYTPLFTPRLLKNVWSFNACPTDCHCQLMDTNNSQAALPSRQALFVNYRRFQGSGFWISLKHKHRKKDINIIKSYISTFSTSINIHKHHQIVSHQPHHITFHNLTEGCPRVGDASRSAKQGLRPEENNEKNIWDIPITLW